MLSESAADVGFGLFVVRIHEDSVGYIVFDEFAEIEESGAVRDSRSLLHVMCNDNDSVVLF